MSETRPNFPIQSFRGKRLVRELREFSSYRMALGWLHAFFMAAGLGVAGFLAVAWVDLIAGLAGAWRAAGLLLLFLGMLALFAHVIRFARRRSRLEKMARDLDRLADGGGQITVGYDFAVENVERESLPRALADVAVEKAERLTQSIPTVRVESLAPAGRAFFFTTGMLLALLLLTAFFPGAAKTEWFRLSRPFADNPPWSRHVFDVTPGDTKVFYGHAVDIRAKVAGAPVDSLDLVIRQKDGTEESMPMFAERDMTWCAQVSGITNELTYWVQAGRARSSRFGIEIIPTPQFEEIRVRVTAPAYTRRPPVEGPMPQGSIAGLPGTEVRITVRSNCPLEKGIMNFTPEGAKSAAQNAVAPESETPTTVTWTFPITRSGKLSLLLQSKEGQLSTAPVEASVMALADDRPLARLLAPKAQSYATPDTSLPVEIDAEDDYGISQVLLYRSLNGSRHLPEDLELPSPPPAHTRLRGELPLAHYRLQPGDVISLFARAVDTEPDRPKGSESPIATVTIISQEMYQAMLRETKTIEDFTAKYEAARRDLDSLTVQGQELREKLEKESSQESSEENRKEAARFAEELRKAAERIAESANKEEFPLDKELAGPLRELAEKLQAAASDAGNAAHAPSNDDMRRQLDSAMEKMGAGRAQYTKQVTEPLEQFAQVYKLAELEAMYMDLANIQEDLAQRTAPYKGMDRVQDNTERVRMRDLRDEQRRVADDLADLLDEISRTAHELPDKEDLAELKQSALAFADVVRGSRASDEMVETGVSLFSFLGDPSAQHSRRAADILNSFLSNCENCAGQANAQGIGAFAPGLRQSAAETMRQLLGSPAEGTGSGGKGSGAGGYSIRTARRPNVGVYGSSQKSESKESEAGRRDRDPFKAVALPHEGGSSGGEIGADEERSMEYDAAQVERLPLPLRDAVRTYFKRVADEISAGTVVETEDPGGRK